MLLHEFCLECNIDLLNYGENKFIETLRCRVEPCQVKFAVDLYPQKSLQNESAPQNRELTFIYNTMPLPMKYSILFFIILTFYSMHEPGFIGLYKLYTQVVSFENKTLLNSSNLTNIVIFWNQNANCRLSYHEHKHERIKFYSIRDCRQSQMQFFFISN